MKYAQTVLLALFLVFFSEPAYAEPREIIVHWQYPQIEGLAGFNLYQEDTLICSTDNPQATSLNCTLDIADGETWFTMTAVFSDGMESSPSPPLSYIFASGLMARFTHDPQQGQSPLTVNFDASASASNGVILSYEWMFGDGDSAVGEVVSHTYAAAGTFDVLLKVFDNTGAYDQESAGITITEPATINAPPVAVLASSTGVGRAPLPVNFDGSGSTDSDGVILSFGWDLGDGGAGSTPLVDHTYTTAGTFYAALTVTDNGGLSDSVSTPVLVQPPLTDNTPPTAVIKAAVRGSGFPLSINFDGGKSSDTDGTITSYSWNFGDGSVGSGKKTDHTFIKSGQYKVSLKVTDDKGAVSSPVYYLAGTTKGEPGVDNDILRVPQVIINFLLLKSTPAENSAAQQKDTQP